MINKKKLTYIIIFLLCSMFIVDVFLYQRSSTESIVGVQDIATAISIPFLLLYMTKTRYDSLKLVYQSMLIYIFYLLINNLTLLLVGEIESSFIFYVLKNMVYFTGFIITYLSFQANTPQSEKIIKYIIYFNSAYGVYLIAAQKISYYGIGTFFETAPSRSGSIYFISTLVSFFFYKKEKESKYMLLLFINAVLTLMTVARTNILAMFIFFVIFFLLEFFKKVSRNLKFKKKHVLAGIIGAIMLTIMLVFVNFDTFWNSDSIFIKSIIERFNGMDSSYNFRQNKGNEYLQYFFEGKGLLSIVFGRGKGITEMLIKTEDVAVDNQYVRSIIEVGLVGIMLWSNVIYNVYKKIPDTRKSFFIAFFISYLAMGISYEVFTVTKAGISFYFMLALLLGYKNNLQTIEKEEINLMKT